VTPHTDDTDQIAIRDVSRRWTAAVAAGDLDTLGRLMTGDIVVIHGNGRTLTGRDAKGVWRVARAIGVVEQK
jgi:ketosteroid isomerase-like protein